jgi:predicted DNA-binding transcriptional regulator AlpA
VPHEPTQPIHRDHLLTERQAAHMLGVSVRTLQSWRVRGGGSGPRFVSISCRCVRYRALDLDEWVNARLRDSTSDPGAMGAE